MKYKYWSKPKTLQCGAPAVNFRKIAEEVKHIW